MALVLSTGSASVSTAARTFEIASDRSRLLIEIGKAGALSFVAGHAHRVEGPIAGTFSVDLASLEDGAVAIEIRTADLQVSAEGEAPEDVPQIQQTMASGAVLDVERYPAITFRSTRLTVDRRHGGSTVALTIVGDLTLHGRTNPVAVPVTAEVSEHEVTARGTLVVKQSDYGIDRVRVAGGLVSVKDELEVSFTIVAAG
jgi:polyisoprenoid-binding protein YceI